MGFWGFWGFWGLNQTGDGLRIAAIDHMGLFRSFGFSVILIVREEEHDIQVIRRILVCRRQ